MERPRLKPIVDAVKSRLARVYPLASHVPESPARRYLKDLPYTKAHSDAADDIPEHKKIPFEDIKRHRKMRGLK